MTRKKQPGFVYSGLDIWIITFTGATLALLVLFGALPFVWQQVLPNLATTDYWALSIGSSLIFLLGFRVSIKVRPSKVVIARTWYFIPYRIYRDEKIKDVFYGGDWGLPEGAGGIVVVKMGDRDVCVGNHWDMHSLHDSLQKWVRK